MSLEIIGNRYHVLQELGKGGMGVVYRAQDRLTGDIVAIKRVSSALPQFEFTGGDSTDIRLGLAQEFRMLATIRHPHIISVLDYGFDHNQQPYFAMELLKNPQSITVYAHDKPLSVKIHLLVQTLQAIAYLHRRGVIHRDIKPDNILVVDDQVKVLDFGLAVGHNQHLEDEDSPVAGTIPYMPPEVLLGSAVSRASDLYAVGVIAYELFAGHHPFNTENVGQLLQDIVSMAPDFSALEIDSALTAVIDRLLAKDPANRYHDAEKTIQALMDATGLDMPYETTATRESFLQSARFVGRTQEIAQLTDALHHAQDHQGSLWMIGGESGVGKSRLIDEISTLALVDHVLVLRGQAIVEGGAAYLLWRNVMRYLCLKVTLNELEASVLKALVPDIATLIDRPVADAPALDPDAEQNRLFNTLEAVFRRHTEPTLIIMEDLQWAKESLGVMSRMAKIIATLPLMIVGTFRDDERPELATYFEEAHTLRLRRLNDTEIGDLSESILGISIGRRDAVVELLRMETEGNAFFIVEIVRALAEEAGQMSLIGQATLPPTVFAGGIRAAIQQRLNRVPREAFTLLEWAAVIGRELDLKFLSYLMPTTQIDQWLLACSSVLDVHENTWRFAHDKLREAILEQISPEQRVQWHGRIAAAMGSFYPNDPAYYVRLAYHWREAGRLAEECRFNILAGSQSLTLGNYHEAIEFLRRALGYFEAHHPDPRRQARLIKQIGDAYFGLGQLDNALESFKQALIPLPPMQPDTPLALYRRMDDGTQQLIYSRRQQVGPRALYRRINLTVHTRAIGGREPDPEDGDYLRDVANAALQLAIVHYFKNEKFYALYYSLKATHLAGQAGRTHRDELSRAQSTFALILSLVPLHRQARLYYDLAKTNMPNNNDAGLRSWVLMMSGLYATNTAEWDIAIPNLVDCLALAEQAGNVRRTQEALLSLAAARFFMGEWKQSYELAEKIMASGLAYNNLQCQAWGFDDLGRVLYHYGEHTKALELFTQSRAIYERIGDTSGLIWVHGALAQVYTRQGDLIAARPHAEAVKHWLFNTQPGNYGLLEGYQGMADFYLTQYENERTLTHREEAEVAVMLMHRFGHIFNTGKAYRFVYEAWLAGLNGEMSVALRLGEQATEEAQRYGLPYEEGLAALHTARLLPQDHPQRAPLLNQAQAIFARIGAQWDLGRALNS